MKEVKVTNHAILRRYQRFNTCSNEGMNTEHLKNEILLDFKETSMILKYPHGTILYGNTNNLYVVKERKNEIIIVTTYPKIDEDVVKKYLVNTKNVYIETKEELDTEVMERLKNNDIVILKHFGRKKLVSIENNLLLLTQEYENIKTIFYVIKAWDVRILNNPFTLSSFKKELFAQSNRIEWEEFLVKLNLYKTVYNYKKYIKNSELHIEELRIYRQVLIGELDDFPADFWENNALLNARLCIKYLIQEVLEWNNNDVINNFDYYVLQKYKLGGVLDSLFNNDSFLALDAVFPGKYKRELLQKFPKDDAEKEQQA